MNILVNDNYVMEAEIVQINLKTGEHTKDTSYIYDYLISNNIQYDSITGYYNMTREQYNDMIDFWRYEINCFFDGYSEYLGEKNNKTHFYLENSFLCKYKDKITSY